jgi:hypothetical protein
MRDGRIDPGRNEASVSFYWTGAALRPSPLSLLFPGSILVGTCSAFLFESQVGF